MIQGGRGGNIIKKITKKNAPRRSAILKIEEEIISKKTLEVEGYCVVRNANFWN